jgi:hypothetical protein
MRPPIRPCLHRDSDGIGCPNLTEGSYCIEHNKQRRRSPSTRVTQSREHRRKRERIVRQGPPWICSICGMPIMSADDMQLHHVVAVANGGAKGKTAPAHALCNRRRGARMS